MGPRSDNLHLSIESQFPWRRTATISISTRNLWGHLIKSKEMGRVYRWSTTKHRFQSFIPLKFHWKEITSAQYAHHNWNRINKNSLRSAIHKLHSNIYVGYLYLCIWSNANWTNIFQAFTVCIIFKNILSNAMQSYSAICMLMECELQVM